MVLSMLSVWSSRSASKSSEVLNPEPSHVSTEENTREESVVDNTEETPSEVPVDDANVGLKPEIQENALERPPSRLQRFSLFNASKTHITKVEETKERTKAHDAGKRANLLQFPSAARSADKAAEKNALAVQRLIVGSSSISPSGAKAPPVSHTQLTKIKSELMQPKAANRLIAKLRALPMPDLPEDKQEDEDKAPAKARGPIHAVCLEDTDSTAKERTFTKLDAASVATASLAALTSLISETHIVDLLTAPDFGLGQPGNGKGLLAGAIPTAETVIEGAQRITPQLMALGYATDRALAMPDHSGIHPPTDRMSVLTYWWGFELCLPPPSLSHLDSVDSVSHEVVNFLTVLSTVNGGVRELLPFVRYISQFVDFEFNAIKAQNKGRGVICAATWIMPAAMVPRPWDFTDAPAQAPGKTTTPSAPVAGQPSASTPADDSTEAAKPADPTRDGNGVVEDIVPNPGGLLPTLLVTPPSVIRTPQPIKAN